MNQVVDLTLDDAPLAIGHDARRILFVCAGAFEGLYDSVYDRVTVGRDRGALQAVSVVEDGGVRQELRFVFRDWVRNDDLFDYGMTPQFLSRFDAVVVLNELGESGREITASRVLALRGNGPSPALTNLGSTLG